MDFISGNSDRSKVQSFNGTADSYGLQTPSFQNPSYGYGLQPLGNNTPALNRIDPTVDLDRNSSAPAPLAQSNNVSNKKAAQVLPSKARMSAPATKSNKGFAALGTGRSSIDANQNKGVRSFSSAQKNNVGRGGNGGTSLNGADPYNAQQVIPQSHSYSSTDAASALAPVARSTSASRGTTDDSLTGQYFNGTNLDSRTPTRSAPRSTQPIIPQTDLYPSVIPPAPVVTSAPSVTSTPVVDPIPVVAPEPPPAPVVAPAPVVIPEGNGLTGKYFNGINLDPSKLALTRTDASVNFNWSSGAPDSKVALDNFSAEWTGQILAPETGTYTFTTTSDDGVRVWVNGKQLIDAWNDHAPQQDSGTITLQAGQKYDIKVDYYERLGGATMQLQWSAPNLAQQIVPQAYLYSSVLTPTPDPVAPSSPTSPSSSALSPAFDDSTLPNEGIPSGVPTYLPWAHGPMKGYGNTMPSGWNAFTAWGQIYVEQGWNPPSDSNTRVQIRALDAWYLSKSTNQWVLIQRADTVSGAAYVEDFANDASKPADVKNESGNGGGISVTAGNGYNYHFWTDRAVIPDPSDIAGVYTKFESRLVLNDPNGPDDRASSRYLASDGADYWRSIDAGWASDWSNNGSVGHGRFKFVNSDWQIFSMETLSPEEMSKNPPPIGGSPS
ncbi:PA14 domain-containing protein [Altericista sp. CCNU0014]|uniref:PA14 domain-containing protein n=1 Tax=Altericista sp. CCNU0014 TaxID=3082949 RepID=UPI003850BB05